MAKIRANVAFADEPVIAAQQSIDPEPGEINNRYMFEFSVVARRVVDGGVAANEVAALFMKKPHADDGNRTIRLAWSDDGGATWTFEDFNAPGSSSAAIEVDPMTAYDPNTEAIWVGGQRGTSAFFVKRRDAGESDFEDGVIISDGNSMTHDKVWMTAGPKIGNLTATRVYVTAQGMDGNELIWSDDLGETWGDPIGVTWANFLPLPRIGPDGVLYIAFPDKTNDEYKVVRSDSLDGSDDPIFGTPVTLATYDNDLDNVGTGPAFASSFRVLNYVALAIDPNDADKVYAVFTNVTSTDTSGNKNVDLYLSKRDSQGDWSTPAHIPTGSTIKGDQFHPWLEVDDYGRLHLIFMDSREVEWDDWGVTENFNGWFEVFYAYSEDEGDTWTEHLLTPMPFNARRAGGIVTGSSHFFGDYLGLAVAGKRVYPFYNDTGPGRSEAFTNIIVFGDLAALDDVTAQTGSTITQGDVDSLEAPDDEDVLIVDEAAATVITKTVLDVGLTSAIDDSEELDLNVVSRSNNPNTVLRISLKNWSTSQFDVVGILNVSGAELTEYWIRCIPTGDYVRASDERIEIRFENEATGSLIQPLETSYDHVRVIAVDVDDLN